MSIIIKDQKMPEDCTQCPCINDEYFQCQTDGNWDKRIGFTQSRPEWCPLVSVPPHGRLIDEKDICDKIRPLIENPYCYNRLQVISETLGNCLQIVRDAPTIIPAEEGE